MELVGCEDAETGNSKRDFRSSWLKSWEIHFIGIYNNNHDVTFKQRKKELFLRYK